MIQSGPVEGRLPADEAARATEMNIEWRNEVGWIVMAAG